MVVVLPEIKTMWVCTHHGEFHADKNQLSGECQQVAQLCYESSLQVRNKRVVFARAINR